MKRKRLIPLFLWLVLASCVHAQTTESFDKRISGLIESRKYDEAISILRERAKSIKNQDVLADIYFQIGDIQYKYLHDYSSAIDMYRKIQKLKLKGNDDTYKVLAQMIEAEVLCRLGKFDDAIGIYDDVCKSHPAGSVYSRVAEQKRTKIVNALDSLKEQKELLKKVRGKPLEVQSLLQIAELYKYELNQPEEAIKLYLEIAERYPDNPASPESLWWTGYLQASMNMIEEAIQTYERVIRLYPMSKFDAEAYFQIGRLKMGLGRYAEAAQTFEELIATRPAFWKLPAAFYWLGICYEKITDYDRAIESFKSFVSIYLPREEHMVWAGDIGKHSESRLKIETEITAKIRQLELEQPNVLWKKANSLLNQGRFQDAARCMRKLISDYPDSPLAVQAISMLQEVERKAEIQECERIAREKKGSLEATMAQFRIAELYEGDPSSQEKAIAEYTKVLNNSDGLWQARALYRIGMIYQNKLANYEEAQKVFERISKEYPQTEYAMMSQYQLGEIYRTHLGMHKKALDAYANTITYPAQVRHLGDGYLDSLVDAARFRIARVYFENLRDMDGALRVLQEFVKSNRQSPRLAAAYMLIGMIYDRKNMRSEAIDAYKKSSDLVLESPVQARMLKAEISEIDLQKGDQAEVAKIINDRIDATRVNTTRTAPLRTRER